MTKRELDTLEKLSAKREQEEREKRQRQRQLDKICRDQLGGSITEIRQKIASLALLEDTLRPLLEFYGLSTVADLRDFCEIMITESSRAYFRRQLSQRSTEGA